MDLISACPLQTFWLMRPFEVVLGGQAVGPQREGMAERFSWKEKC